MRKEIYHKMCILYFKASGLKTDKGLRKGQQLPED